MPTSIYYSNANSGERQTRIDFITGEAEGTFRLWSFNKPHHIQFSTDANTDENGENGSGFDQDNAYLTSSIIYHSKFEAAE